MLRKLSVMLMITSLLWQISYAFNCPRRHNIQIETTFNKVYGHPTWELILRDTETGMVWPYMFDIACKNNSWSAYIIARNYQITVSKLQYGPFAEINNFCCLENTTMDDKSANIILTGNLSPDPHSFRCRVMMFQDG